jgi:asparagine synthase (glutamine-hydrolysing)
LKQHIFSQEQYYFSLQESQKILNKAFQIPLLLNENPALARKFNATESQALFDLMYYLPDDLLVKVDRASMRFSLEDRVPLLDYQIVSFALNLDPNLKMHKGIQKYILKEVLYDYVPREVFNRPKWGFSIPMNKWLKGDLNFLIGEYLAEEKMAEAGFVKPEEVTKLIQEYLTTNKEFLYNRVWVLICLHQWYHEVYKNL